MGCFPFSSLSLHAESSCCFPLSVPLHLSFNSILCFFLHTSLSQCSPALRWRNLPRLLFTPLCHGGKSLYSFTLTGFYFSVSQMNVHFVILVLSAGTGKQLPSGQILCFQLFKVGFLFRFAQNRKQFWGLEVTVWSHIYVHSLLVMEWTHRTIKESKRCGDKM